MNLPPKKTTKRKPKDLYEPLTFKDDDPRRMSAKEQGEDLLRILIAGLQRKLGQSQTTTHPQVGSRSRKTEADAAGYRSASVPQQPDRLPEICRFHSVMVILSEELLAERWFCSVSRLQRWRSEKVGPPYLRMGGRVLYRLSDIEAYEQSCLVVPGAEKQS